MTSDLLIKYFSPLYLVSSYEKESIDVEVVWQIVYMHKTEL